MPFGLGSKPKPKLGLKIVLREMGKILGKSGRPGEFPKVNALFLHANFLRLVDGEPLIFTPSLALETPLFTSFPAGSYL